MINQLPVRAAEADDREFAYIEIVVSAPEWPNGASVATSRPRICVTVARQEPEWPNGARVATLRSRICVRAVQKWAAAHLREQNLR